MHWKLLSLAALCLASPGCSLSSPCESAPSTTLELGGGLDEFVPFDESPTLDLVYGPQGGVHVEVSLLATGLDATASWQTQLSGSQEGTVMAATLDTLPQPRCREDGSGAVVSGLRLIFEDWVRPGDFDQPIEILAEVRDQQGGVAEAVQETVWVVVP